MGRVQGRGRQRTSGEGTAVIQVWEGLDLAAAAETMRSRQILETFRR